MAKQRIHIKKTIQKTTKKIKLRKSKNKQVRCASCGRFL